MLYQQFILHGFFPTSPIQPRVVVSIQLMDFYLKLHERSGDAVTGFALALKDFYELNGMRAVDSNVS